MGWAAKGKRQAGGSAETQFLDRWKKSAAWRRLRLEELLAGGTVTAQRRAELTAWHKGIAAKKAWLMARLEHLTEVEKLLESALKDKPQS